MAPSSQPPDHHLPIVVSCYNDRVCQVEADVGQAGLALRDHCLVDNGEHVEEDDDGGEEEDEDGDNSEHLNAQWLVFVMVEVEDVNLAVDRDSSKDGALDGVHCKEM